MGGGSPPGSYPTSLLRPIGVLWDIISMKTQNKILPIFFQKSPFIVDFTNLFGYLLKRIKYYNDYSL